MRDSSEGYTARKADDGHALRPGGPTRSHGVAQRRTSDGPHPREGRAAAGRASAPERSASGASAAEGRDARRPGARPSSHTGGLPASSGRIPAQRSSSPQSRNPQHTPSASAAGRPHRTGETPRVRERTPHPEPGASPCHDRDRQPRIAQKPKRKGLSRAALLASVAAVAVVIVGVVLFVQSLPANIVLNGASLEVRGGKTLGDALSASGIKPQPGDLVAVDGSVLEAGKGEPFHATVNGTVVTELDTKLGSGDVVELGNGNPVEEPSDAVEQVVPWAVEVEGNGAIHLVEGEGKDGMKATKTGRLSGITAEQVTQEPGNVKVRNVSPDTGDDKVIALTFDDGPWGDQTGQVLDVLAQQGAKATFFTVGNRIERDDGASFVKRAASEGHQICTHSYDHASGSGQGVNLGYMTPEEQKAEIEKGYAAIEAATGAEASRIVRTPGGNFGEDVVKNIGPLIKAEIGWNIDSSDWRRPGPGAIVDEIEGAWPGAIVLMHDGGGDRSQTIEALKTALPRLKEQGYRFITIDELLQYPLS